MKVTVKEQPTVKYPYIGRHEIFAKLIVLFASKGKGTVLQTDKNHSVGEYSDTWIESNFKPFEGTIELSNY